MLYDLQLTKPTVLLPDNLKKSMKIFKYFKTPILLVGSSNIRNLMFFGDFDLLSSVEIKHPAEKSYREFNRILEDAKKTDFLYFVEVKIQLKNGDKIRNFVDLAKYKKIYENIDFIKFDFILFDDSVFYELSSLYIIKYGKEETKKKINDNIESLKSEIPDLQKENKYYKMLKRIFSIAKLKNDELTMNNLTSFFNKNGRDYQNMANLEAIEKIFELDKEPLTLKRIKNNLKLLKVDAEDISNKIDSFKNDLQNKAKKFYNTLK